MKQPTPLHKKKDCKGEYCCFHSPSDHHMNKWEMVVRYDRGAMTERICPHGIGHPDPDSVAWLKRNNAYDGGVHGCDGCCINKKKMKFYPCADCGDTMQHANPYACIKSLSSRIKFLEDQVFRNRR